jgi:hypothetical protein
MIAFSSIVSSLLADPSSVALAERRADAELHTVAARDLDRPQRHDARAARRHLEHLLVRDVVELQRLGDETRIGGEDAGHVGEDLARGAESGGERDGRGVGAAAAERR